MGKKFQTLKRKLSRTKTNEPVEEAEPEPHSEEETVVEGNLVLNKKYHVNSNVVELRYFTNEDNQTHGKLQRFAESGALVKEVDYVNGKIHGKSITYNEDGSVQSEIDYNNGKRVN